uniref:Myosin VIIA and Rab interacting protein a n=2 Tax=Nothobranchius furzeri TaxID=105023 RepID=A0A8C6LBJ7_NOTFU
MMGRKLDLTGLSDNEATHVLQVVQRDMRLRKKEEERLSELKQELDEEGSRCLLLSRQSCFNQRCCIRCCSPFTFLLNPKGRCRDCSYNVCKACRVYNQRDKAWLCSACQKCRLLKTQSLEWFYTNVKKRFKRFGSAKVLKTLYRKHLAEHSALSELTEGSACDESICNEDSVSGSDSTFYRQTEEHSLEETLTVAMRVAEEAIDEAISRAEFDTSTQKKQNEAHYLQEHKGELIEELARTIVQKITSRRNSSAEMRAEYDHKWPSEQNTSLHPHQSNCDQVSGSLKANLWRSHSAFTLDDCSCTPEQNCLTALKNEASGLAMTAWKSVDRLDNSVLKSPDGNWIALQSAQLSRPSLLTKRKSLVYSALERESGVVSAYEGLGSDNETKPEADSAWGAVLQEIHRKMTDSKFTSHGHNVTPLVDPHVCSDDPFSDSEGHWKPIKHLLVHLKKKVPAEIRKPLSSRRTSIIDVNFNLKGGGEREGVKMAAQPETRKIRKSRKKRSKKKPSSVLDLNRESDPLHPSDAVTPTTPTSEASTPEPFDLDGDVTGKDFSLNVHQSEGRVSDFDMREGPEKDRSDGETGVMTRQRDMDLGGLTPEEEEKEKDEEVRCSLYRLVSQSNLTYFSSTKDDLDRVGQSEGEGDTEEEQKSLSNRLFQLEKRVQAMQFSSTEDELDRMGVEEDENEEDLAVKLCRLANEVNASQFSSTEDELDRVGRGEDEEEVTDEETLWKLQPDRSQLRDLVSLVRASQFSSTEDELDRVGEKEGEMEQKVKQEIGSEMKELWEGAESMGDIDMKMFDLTDETEEMREQKSDENTREDVFDSWKETEDVWDDERDVKKGRNLLDERVKGNTSAGKEQLCVKDLEVFKPEKVLEPKERQEAHFKTREDAERTEHEIKPEPETEPAAKMNDEMEEFIKEGNERERKWKLAARSDEEDLEFDRIISSMLMMTLEDMQVETMKDTDGKSERRLEEVENSREQERKSVEQRKDASEETEQVSDERTEKIISNQRTRGVRGGNMEDGGQTCLTREKIKDSDQTSPESDLEETRVEGDMMETNAANENIKEVEQSSSPPHGGFLSPEEFQSKYSAASLRSITTEVLKVLNTTEELLQGVDAQNHTWHPSVSLPPNMDPKTLDQQFSRLEENVYVAAGPVYGLEAELSDLEECARGICSSTSDMELTFLEEQVAATAARVQQSELQIGNISARIAALKSAGLNVDPQLRVTKARTSSVTPVTLDSSRHMRRRLPAPPVKGENLLSRIVFAHQSAV